MTEPHELSIVDELESDPRARLELALAEVQLRMEELLEVAFEARSDVSAADLAAIVGVPTERVLRLLDGEDSLSSEAFVRYMRALGYSVLLNPRALDDAAPELPARIQRWPADVVESYWQKAATRDGVHEIKWMRFRSRTSELHVLDQPQLAEVREGSTGRLLSTAIPQPVVEFREWSTIPASEDANALT